MAGVLDLKLPEQMVFQRQHHDHWDFYFPVIGWGFKRASNSVDSATVRVHVGLHSVHCLGHSACMHITEPFQYASSYSVCIVLNASADILVVRPSCAWVVC